MCGGAGGWGEALNRIAAFLRAFTDIFQGTGLPGTGPSLQTVDAVGGVEYLFDGEALRGIELRAGVGLLPRTLCRHHGRNGVAACEDMGDVGALGGDGFGCGEAAPGGILGSVDGTEVPMLPACVELCAHIGVGGLPHAATQRIAED